MTSNPTRRAALAALAGIATAPPTGLVHAAGNFPDGRPVKLIVPYTPGGGTDAIARFIADKITSETGWTMVVENRPGAGGNIGMDAVSKAKPDGLMLGLGQTANLAINPALLPKMPFDAAKDFAPVVLVASLPVVMVIRAESPWQNLADFVRAAQAKRGELKQALAATGTVGHMAGELLAFRAKFQVLNVPYRGAAPALTELLGGNTDYMFATPQSVQEMLKGKRLRALAVTSRARLPIFPDVPTVAEAGYPGFEATDWKAIVAPVGTPQEIVKAINTAAEKALSKPATMALLATEGSTAMGGSPEQARKYIFEEQVKWAKLIREARISF